MALVSDVAIAIAIAMNAKVAILALADDTDGTIEGAAQPELALAGVFMASSDSCVSLYEVMEESYCAFDMGRLQ